MTTTVILIIKIIQQSYYSSHWQHPQGVIWLTLTINPVCFRYAMYLLVLEMTIALWAFYLSSQNKTKVVLISKYCTMKCMRRKHTCMCYYTYRFHFCNSWREKYLFGVVHNDGGVDILLYNCLLWWCFFRWLLRHKSTVLIKIYLFSFLLSHIHTHYNSTTPIFTSHATSPTMQQQQHDTKWLPL